VLEARLAPGSAPVDLSIRLTAPAQASSVADQDLPAQLRSFLFRWAGDDAVRPRVPVLWLEFDLDHDSPHLPVPTLCAGLGEGAVDVEWLADVLAPALLGEPLSQIGRELLHRCCTEIPGSGRLLYVFGMLPRPSRPLRLEILGLDSAQAVEYLQRIAPHAVRHAAAVAPLFADVARLHLSFDLSAGGDQVHSRIGLEGSYSRQPERETRWSGLFDRLVAAGLCSTAKRDAVFAWPGQDTFWTAAERWPILEREVAACCVRSLSHVKVVCRPDRDPEAKVYLLFGRHERSASGVRATPRSPASRSVRST
jgi:hypothetical protein